MIKERLSKAKEQLDNALEALFFLCEPVEPPQDSQNYIEYFCGNTEIQSDIDERAFRRNSLYQAIATLIRAYADIANELESAGYSSQQATEIKQKVTDYKNLRDVIRSASGEYLDLKPYEAGMRYLIDTYIEADEPRKISEFDQLPLIDLIIKTSIQETINHLPPGIRNNRRNVAETIENNVRRVIVQEQLNDPAYYAKMSALLDDLIQTRKREAIAYEELLKRYAELAQKVRQGKEDDTPPELDTPGKLALYNNLDHNLALALEIDATVKQIRGDDWRGIKARENVIKKALFDLLNNGNEVERIFVIIKNQSEY